MKRLYKVVSVREDAQGFSILLDRKPVHTPGKNPLSVTSKKLAEAVMAEWAAQKEHIIPDTMPLTQIASTCIDRIPHERAAMTEIIMEYLDTDLVCYRATQPPELVERQGAVWDPWLTWFEIHFGVLPLTTNALSVLRQPQQAHNALRKFITSLSDEQFTVLQMVTALSGSVIMAAGFMGGTDVEMMLYGMRVDQHYKAELYNEEKYGPDPAQEKKDKAVERDLEAARRFLNLI